MGVGDSACSPGQTNNVGEWGSGELQGQLQTDSSILPQQYRYQVEPWREQFPISNSAWAPLQGPDPDWGALAPPPSPATYTHMHSHTYVHLGIHKSHTHAAEVGYHVTCSHLWSLLNLEIEKNREPLGWCLLGRGGIKHRRRRVRASI